MLDQAKMEQIKAQQKNKQKGASMIEYALVVAAVVAIGAVFFGTNGTISTAINSKLTNVAANIK